jgi:hypothetical protein
MKIKNNNKHKIHYIMKKNLFFMVMLALSVITMFSCSGGFDDLEHIANNETPATPSTWQPVSSEVIAIYDSNNEMIKTVANPFSLSAEDTLRVDGNEGLSTASGETLQRTVDGTSYVFNYTYNVRNVCKITGYPVKYTHSDGKEYTLSLRRGTLTLKGQHSVVKTQKAPFKELSTTQYTLVADDVVLAKADQMFIVSEGEKVSARNWRYEHVAYSREASYVNNIATVKCDNRAFGSVVYNTGREERDTAVYNVDNKFAVAVSAVTVDKLSSVVGTTIKAASDGSFTVSAGEVIRFAWVSAQLTDDVMLNGTNYRDSIAACVVRPQTLTINSASSATVRFYEDSKPDDYAELVVAISLREKEVVAPTVVSTSFTYSHVAVNRVGSLSGSTATAHCTNNAVVTSLWSDKSETTASTNYNVDNIFSLSLAQIVVASVNDVIGQRYNFTNGSVTVGNAVLKATWVSASVTDATVVVDGTDYKAKITPCKMVAHSIFFNSVSRATVRFCLETSNADYADVEVSISMSEETPSWSTKHNSWTSASLSGSQIYVNCSNTAAFTYSVNTANNEDVAYTCQTTFSWSGLTMEVESLNSVVGKTFTFNNGVATIEGGKTATCKFVSAKVSSDVNHRGTNYKSQITACVAKAITITFNSSTSATILLGEGSDNAAVTVPVSVTEAAKVVTLTNISRSFTHNAYRSNATVNGNTISITCDNTASFVKEYSDGHKDNAVAVNYTVVNNFNLTMPTFVGAQPSGTFAFNNGTATVSGQNVVVTFASRTIADIMFESENYVTEAPVCKVTPKSVTFNNGTAEITFVDNNETVTVEVPVTVVSAEEIDGQILKIVVTDSYIGRTYTASYLHILTAEGKVYSRISTANTNADFTVTTLSSSELAVAKTVDLAYYNYQNTWHLGYVKATSSESCGYILQYYTLTNQLALALGKAESTLNGKDFEYPVKVASYDEATGMWSINGQYFVSK